MTPSAPFSPHTKAANLTAVFAEPILNRIREESREEFSELQKAFKLMGWSDLPDQLKIEIWDDVRFMVEELKGMYSSCDPYVEQRRNTVHYWISCYRDGICSIETAIKQLKVKPL